jgi:hypothetical protein
MKRTAKYAGLDVHQATTVASVREAGGRVIARSILPTEATALVEFFRGMRGAVHVAFEEGTQAQWLHDLLAPVTHRVIVCDRRGERRRRGNKADQVDADELSHRLLAGDLRPVYHGSSDRRLLQELTRTYLNIVDDATRAMLRLKALFRARAVRASGERVYAPRNRQEWLAKLPDRGARFRAGMLFAELDLLRELRPKAKAAMFAEARHDPAWNVLSSIPFYGPVRVSLLLATMKTPWRFRTKRNLWAYAGLAVITETSAEHEFVAGRPVRRYRKPLTRGLNQNHNRILKDLFKSTAVSSLTQSGPFRDLYHGMLARGTREEMARLTLARKFAALTLRLWKTGEAYDPAKLTTQAT